MFQSRACAVLRSRVSLSWRRKTKAAPPWQPTTATTCTQARAAYSGGSPPLCAIPPAPGTTLIQSQNCPVKRTMEKENGGKNSAQSAARDVCGIMIPWRGSWISRIKVFTKTTLFYQNIAEFRKILYANNNSLENLHNLIPERLKTLSK